MAAFHPEALTISRGDLWADRRGFAEAVLDTDRPTHRLAQGFAPGKSRRTASRAHQPIPATTRRRLSEADPACRLRRRPLPKHEHTDQLSYADGGATRCPASPPWGYDAIPCRARGLREDPDPQSARRADRRRSPAGPSAGQLVHWLFAMGDTLGATCCARWPCWRRIPIHDEARAEMAAAEPDRRQICQRDLPCRLLVRGDAVVADDHTVRAGGRSRTPVGAARSPEGTQVLIHNVFNHRNRDASRTPTASRPGSGSAATRATTGGSTSSATGRRAVPAPGYRSSSGRRSWDSWSPPGPQAGERPPAQARATSLRARRLRPRGASLAGAVDRMRE